MPPAFLHFLIPLHADINAFNANFITQSGKNQGNFVREWNNLDLQNSDTLKKQALQGEILLYL
jgi:hypothetical protein